MKKDKKVNWHDFGEIPVYDGVGLKGELELYFKDIGEIILKIETMERAKESITTLISQGQTRFRMHCSRTSQYVI